MITEISTVCFKGIEILDVNVQIHIQSGLPAFHIVGLPDKTIAESRDRISSALNNLGISLPAKKIIVNLAPADLTKEGSHFDLPIVLGILQLINIVPAESLEDYCIMGEISLDGKILSVPGVLPASMHANKKQKGVICPKENGAEAVWSGNELILAPGHISNLINHFRDNQKLCYPPRGEIKRENYRAIDFKDVIGQESAKRALEIAAVGNHNVLMVGPPGAGKSMLAERLNTVLPKLDSEEILDTSMVLSISGQIKNGSLTDVPPFRAPHHSCSAAAMIGGGQGKRVLPGEISLAHNGVLFLDELPEFSKTVIDSLRQPIEVGHVNIARANMHVTYPAKFQLVAAMNPCKCGYLASSTRSCRRAPICGHDYANKISGPIYDRFDIFTEVPEIKPSNIQKYSNVPRETSKDIAERVQNARMFQLDRYKNEHIKTNSQLQGKLLTKYINFTEKAEGLLAQIVEKLHISMRGYYRIQRLARSIADLDLSEKITEHHLLEAANYRASLKEKALT